MKIEKTILRIREKNTWEMCKTGVLPFTIYYLNAKLFEKLCTQMGHSNRFRVRLSWLSLPLKIKE